MSTELWVSQQLEPLALIGYLALLFWQAQAYSLSLTSNLTKLGGPLLFCCFLFAFQSFVVCLLSSVRIHSLFIDFKAIVWDAGGTEQSQLLKEAFATCKAECRLFFM